MKNNNKLNTPAKLLYFCLLTSIAAMPVSADQWKTKAELNVEKTKKTFSEQTTQAPQPSKSTTDEVLKHKTPDSVPAGERLLIKTKIKGKDGVRLARVYFKTASSKQYNFVVLNKGERGIYTAQIPATGKAVSAIDYKIVVQNAFGEVYKSEKYSVPVSAATSSTVAKSDSFIDVFSEYPEKETQESFSGFVDNIRFTYGVTELLASTSTGVGSAVGSSSATATSSTAATTATTTTATTVASTAGAATAGGISTTALVAGGVVVAGGAAAAGGGSSSSGSSSGGIIDDELGGSEDPNPDQDGLVGGSGILRANLVYQTSGFDLDLVLETPCGTIDFNQPTQTCDGFTGTLDIDAGVENTDTVENIVFPDGAASGLYEITLVNQESSPEDYTIRLFVGSSSQTFTGTINGDEIRSIDSFTY